MQKITPFLWFDDQAEEAVNFYTSIFKDSKVGTITRMGEEVPGPKGKVMTITFQLAGGEFMALNGGPVFNFTPAVSFFVTCETQEEIDGLFDKLSQGGTVLMELDKYPFSEKFGWVQDRFGVSWQLNLARLKQKIAPFLMFVGEQHGKAQEAINFYTSLYKNSSIIMVAPYGPGQDEPAGTVSHAMFTLNGQQFMAMDSNRAHAFTFTPAISFFVNCETQDEVDKFWEKLSAGGEKGQCGWLQDKYGVSWQIVPTILGQLLSDPDPEKARRVTQAMLQMKKLEIGLLEQAYEGGKG
jgi:predicted 3-demethylubiquinone-9 3-methyltransferase (glyoxalase superfamily)